MNSSLTNTEFFCFEGEVWYRQPNQSISILKETDIDMIDAIIAHIVTFYPKAYEALCCEYNGCALNRQYFKYRIATRFIRCNFSQLDNVPDYSDGGKCTFEYVSCPLRGECKYENVICRPEFDHKLSSAELPVLKMWYSGMSVDEIASALCLSPHTVHNHINHAYQRLNIHSRAEFVSYASQNKLFS